MSMGDYYILVIWDFLHIFLAQNCTSPPSPKSNMVVVDENDQIIDDLEHTHETTVM